ncbi:complex I intermediate-associated protein 30-domain-containing protein [Haematococcus lacustris]
MDRVSNVLREAINRGAPVYNLGRKAECYSIYKTAASQLLQTGAVPEHSAAALRQALALAERQQDHDSQAWTMRRTFDKLLDSSAEAPDPRSQQSGPGERLALDGAQLARLRWQALDDVVMGGVSSSQVTYDAQQQALLFAGHVSSARNGGFASCRSAPWGGWQGLRGCSALCLQVLGDGRTYKIDLKMDDGYDGVQYQHDFTTTSLGKWQEVRLPFSGFIPSFRGQAVRGQPPLEPGRVRQLGLKVSKFRAEGGVAGDFVAGDFRLAVRSIRGV